MITMLKDLYAQIGNDGARYWNWYTDNIRPDQGYFIDGHNTPWCAEFVSYMLAHWGATSTWFPSSTTFDKTCIPENERIYGTDLRPLDVLSFDWGEDNYESGDHTGFVISSHDWGCVTIEGNCGSDLRVHEMQRPWDVILFGIRPNYKEVPEVVTDDDVKAIARATNEYVYSDYNIEHNRNLYNMVNWMFDNVMEMRQEVAEIRRILDER